MSPLISVLEKESKPDSNKHEHQGIQNSATDSASGCGKCACLTPCDNCTCRHKKER